MNNTISEGTLSARRIWERAPLIALMPERVPDWGIVETDKERDQRITRELWAAKLQEGTAMTQQFEERESAGRVLASLESGSDEVNYHAPLVDDRIDGSMRALGVAILMAAVICVLVAIAAFAGWVPWAV
jgi:hypothetical protein